MSKQSGYWLNREKDASEYDQIYYYLRASTFGATISKFEVWKIQNLEFTYQYQNRTKSLQKLASWTNARKLDAEKNNLEAVCDQGFNFENKGMEFKTGVIEEARNCGDEGEADREHTFLYSEVAVGRSFVYSNDLIDRESAVEIPIPLGYDSLYIPSKPLDRDKDGKFSLAEYQSAARFDDRNPMDYTHSYYLKDELQVCPKYIVKFSLGRPGQFLRSKDSTGGADESAYVDPISFAPIDMRNGASRGERNFISIEKAFNRVVEDSNSLDPITKSKEKWSEKQLDIIDEKVREINLNYAEVSEAITNAAEEAQKKLQRMTKEKLQVCLSMEVELRRQQEQMQWLESSIAKQLEAITEYLEGNSIATKIDENRVKLDFLRSWKCHTVFRNALSRAKPAELQSLSTINADLKVQSDIKIFLDPFYSQGAAGVTTAPLDGKPPVSNDKDTFLEKLSKANKGHFAIYPKPAQPALPLPLENLVDSEVESIQAAIAKALSSNSGIPLPSSITRPAIVGVDYSLPLHALLSGLKEVDAQSSSTSLGDDEYIRNKGASNVELEFLSSLRHAVGSSPTAESKEEEDGRGDGREEKEREDAHSLPSVQENAPESVLTYNDEHEPSLNPFFSQPSSEVKTKVSPKTPNAIPLQKKSAHKKEALKQDLANFSMSSAQLRKTLTGAYAPYLLQELGARKMKQVQAKRGIEMGPAFEFVLEHAVALGRDYEEGLASLSESEILSSEEELLQLYFSLPSFSAPPMCSLLFSTNSHKPTLAALYSHTMRSKGPCVLLIKSEQGMTFGVYLSHPIVPSGVWQGSPSCFLFNLSVGLKLPYHARNAADVGSEDPLAFFLEEAQMFFGYGDLSINADLLTGSSELENCYGVGMAPGSPEALCALAGSPIFSISEIEVWSLDKSNNTKRP